MSNLATQQNLTCNGTNLPALLSANVYSNGWTLESILNEFIDNSVDAIEKRRSIDNNHPNPQIKFTLDQPKKQLIMTDQGIGMDQNNLNTFVSFFQSTNDNPSLSTGRFGIGGSIGLAYLTDLKHTAHILSNPYNSDDVYETRIDYLEVMQYGKHQPNAMPVTVTSKNLYEYFLGSSCGTVIIIDLPDNRWCQVSKLIDLMDGSDYIDNHLPFLYSPCLSIGITFKIIDETSSFDSPLRETSIQMRHKVDTTHPSYNEYSVALCITPSGKFDLVISGNTNQLLGKKQTKRSNNTLCHAPTIKVTTSCCETTNGIYIERNGRTLNRIKLEPKTAGDFDKRPHVIKSTFIISYEADPEGILDDYFGVQFNKSRLNTSSVFYQEIKNIASRLWKYLKYNEYFISDSSRAPKTRLNATLNNDDIVSSNKIGDLLFECVAAPANKLEVKQNTVILNSITFAPGGVGFKLRDFLVAQCKSLNQQDRLRYLDEFETLQNKYLMTNTE